MFEINYLRVEGESITGSYGSGLTRSDLSNARFEEIHELTFKKKMPSIIGYGLVGSGVLSLFTMSGTSPEDRASWPLSQLLGDFEVFALLAAIAIGVWMIVRKRKLSKTIANNFVVVGSDRKKAVPVLAANDESWARTAADKLASLQQPGSGDWEFMASERRISRIGEH